MRHLWVFLMLCAAAAPVAAECNAARQAAGPGATTPAGSAGKALTVAPQAARQMQGPAALKVSAVPAANAVQAPQAPGPHDAATLQPPGHTPLGAPLLISALAMLAIALRRGGR